MCGEGVSVQVRPDAFKLRTAPGHMVFRSEEWTAQFGDRFVRTDLRPDEEEESSCQQLVRHEAHVIIDTALEALTCRLFEAAEGSN